MVSSNFTARSGNIELRLCTYSKYQPKSEYREYIQARLLEPLEKDSMYFFEMYVRKATNFRYATNGIGMAFSSDSIYSENKDYFMLPIKPVIFAKDIIYSKDWISISDSFKANGEEKYIIIGNFFSIKQTKKSKIKEGQYYSSAYFIDDILLKPLYKEQDLKVEDTYTIKTDSIISYSTSSIGFEFNEYLLTPRTKTFLNEIISEVRFYDIISISVIGHSDNVGQETYNKSLSYKRAETISAYLKQFLNQNIIYLNKGVGSNNSIANNNSPEGREKNRRVEIKFKIKQN